MKIYNSVVELIGSTPMIKLNRIMEKKKLDFQLFAKLESFNPAGSQKDRVAYNMIKKAEQAGILKPGGTIIEPTSGNTGIGLAMVSDALGYRVLLTMPETMSIERRNLLKAYGAELVLTPGSLGMTGAVQKAEELQKEIPGSWIAGQFVNPDNPEAHYLTTGPEIYEQMDGKIDIFIAGIGTGGTISGTGRFLKEKNPKIKVIGFEPLSSPLLTEGHAGSHGLQGIGANFIPDALDREIYDEIVTISEEEAYEMGRVIARDEGILVGITAGACLACALKLGTREENRGRNIVCLLPDGGEKYLTTGMF